MHEWYILLLLRAQSIKAYGGVYVTLGRLWRRHEFALVPSHGSLLVFTPVRNLQRCHLNAKRPLVSV